MPTATTYGRPYPDPTPNPNTRSAPIESWTPTASATVNTRRPTFVNPNTNDRTRIDAAAFASTPGGSLAEQVNGMVQPWWKQAIENTKAGLADSGMLQSTGGAQRLGDVNSQYASRAQELFNTYDLQNRQLNENMAMARANLGADIWERITARELQKKQLDSTYKTQMPVDPDFYKYFQGYDFIPQGFGPTGDSNPATKWDRVDGGMANTDAGRAAVENQRQFDKNYALQKASTDAYIASQKSQSDASNPWMEMAQTALSNYQMGEDGKVKPFISPDALLESFNAAYKMDIRGSALAGDARAAALMQAIYGDDSWKNNVAAPDVAGEMAAKANPIEPQPFRLGGSSWNDKGPYWNANFLPGATYSEPKVEIPSRNASQTAGEYYAAKGDAPGLMNAQMTAKPEWWQFWK